jgi:hypothetical protein
MLQKTPLIFILYIFFIVSCDNAVSYSLEELENNKYNNLKMQVEAAMDKAGYESMFSQFVTMNKGQILNRMSADNLELHVASYGFYYLANQYASEGKNDSALIYHQIAADQYINPQSLLKLSEFYFFREKDYTKAYEYLHQSLEVTVEITDNNRIHPLTKNIKNKAQHMLEEMNSAGARNVFDIVAVRKKLKAELPELLKKYREIYCLGLRKE